MCNRLRRELAAAPDGIDFALVVQNSGDQFSLTSSERPTIFRCSGTLPKEE
jgi:hypothetical protein